jgi:excinuclease ABC subunit B
MRYAIDETERRRAIQNEYNENHGIVPATIRKDIFELDPSLGAADYVAVPAKGGQTDKSPPKDPEELADFIEELRSEMLLAAESLEFEKAAELRDRLASAEKSLGKGGSGGRGAGRSGQKTGSSAKQGRSRTEAERGSQRRRGDRGSARRKPPARGKA